jgi:hypothetical protein
MSDRIKHLVITEFEIDIYKIVIFQDIEGTYLTMNIDFIV